MSTEQRPPSANQLLFYATKQKNVKEVATTGSGNPIPGKDASLTVGKDGPILLQDIVNIDEVAHFNRERIPERVVHAKGAGAFGYFEVTNDITEFSAAKVFDTIGKRTPIAVRFSQVTNEMGSADTVRDPRGFAVKFYTEDGIWDIVGNNTPIFFIRDTILFPSFIHILKRNPVTNLRDWDMYWDFFSLRPETMHQMLVLYSDRGIPDGYRYMHGYGSNTFSFVNAKGDFNYCKFHYKTDQGIRNIFSDQARIIAGADPDYSLRDLYNAIAEGRSPSWTFYVQILNPKQVDKLSFNPFDVTKTWPHADFPLIPVGRLVLNKNPSNYFAEVEQLGFSPANLIPGIDVSPDRMLQGRLFAYNDTQRYRIGVNHEQLPVNSPSKAKNFNRAGKFTLESQGGAPNYHPNSFHGPEPSIIAKELSPSFSLVGNTVRIDTSLLEDNFTQGRILYQRVLPPQERQRLIDNIAFDLKNATQFIQERLISNLLQVDEGLGNGVRDGIRRHVHAAI
ncbi:PREDICTED: catalase-like [Nicrophorus vespilloides]|uniref:Catalase n=1 Tax=Nicrophorus vespilloides TaxID=110193 RepID=A0ABM1N6Z3_NICVS|nr:PREDICTED: catalase-like [Nicrophorus vespilloides]